MIVEESRLEELIILARRSSRVRGLVLYLSDEDMDRCIATVQKTIAAAADSAVLLTEASKR